MVTIYGCLRSRATRPIWLMYEAGAEFRHVPVIQSYRLPDPAAADAPFHTASPGFLAVNPQGQIPAMQDGDLVLTESLGITLYLARKLGGDLGPRDAAEDALAVQWALVAATAVETPAIDILSTHSKGLAATEDGARTIAAAQAALVRPFTRLEAHLQGRDWMMGDRFTVADIVLAECVRYTTAQADTLNPYPALKAWLARCQARPAFQHMWAQRTAEPM